MTGVTFWLIALVVWITITTIFAVQGELAREQWMFVLKIQIMNFLTMIVINNRERIHALVWTIVLCIGVYGVKGGLFTIVGGGGGVVWGPRGSFFEDNNALALALIMVIPLVFYLYRQSEEIWLRRGLFIAGLLLGISVVGSHSRGALLGGIVMLATMILKSRRRVLGLMAGGLFVVGVFAFAPTEWVDRMHTIETYEEDGSAQARIRAWTFATLYALDHPLLGGGFNIFEDLALQRSYVPEVDWARNFHSVYFEVLACHGFTGLFIFIMLGLTAYITAARVGAAAVRLPDMGWVRDLAGMLQCSLVGFAVSGAFLNLSMFDLFYTILGIIAVLAVVVRQERHRAMHDHASPLATAGIDAGVAGRTRKPRQPRVLT